MTNIDTLKEEVRKKTVDDWLDEVDYDNDRNYVPSEFALMYLAFIKLVNGIEGEENKTPVVHLKMLDRLILTEKKRVVNLCFRGAAKTTLFFEYLVLFIAVFGGLPGKKKTTGMIYVSDSMDNGVKSARKNIEFRYWNSQFLQDCLPKENVKFTDPLIRFQNKDGHRLGVKMFGAKTGIRGTKIDGKRPTLAVLDDLISDEDAKSPTSLKTIKDTVYKGIDYALHPEDNTVVFNGTPFNHDDPMIEAVESGAWEVNVWPVCEKFPCSREEFRGAWEDRFSYDYVSNQYEMSVKTGKIDAFMQELMLRISSAENRLVTDDEIMWYSRADLLKNRKYFNFYITTDFAVSDKQTADFSVISVWAYSSTGAWFWVDGICKRQGMEKNVEDLFRLCKKYRPQSVGIEVTGQQAGFIPWFNKEMIQRNFFFTYATSGNNNAPGVRPVSNKLARFNLVVPLFKTQKIWFPEELRHSSVMAEALAQIKLATIAGLKGKDDFIDTISMLNEMKPFAPTVPSGQEAVSVFGFDGDDEEDDDFMPNTGSSPLSRYI